MNTKLNQIAALLSEVIVGELILLHSEQTFPVADADRSDDIIKSQQNRIDNLAAIRREIEFMSAGFDNAPCNCEQPTQAIAISLDALFGAMRKDEPKTGSTVPSEKAQTAAMAANRAGTSVGGSAADFLTSGGANG